MSKPEILLVRPMSTLLEEGLDASYRVHRLYASADPEQLLDKVGPTIRTVVIGGATGLPAALMQRLPALELISVHGVGADKLDLAEAARRGVRVTFTHDVLTDDVADMAIALWLSAARRLCEGDRYVRSGGWLAEAPLPLARTASGLKVGILGLGKIGSAIAARVGPFAPDIRYHSRTPVPDAPYPYVSSARALAEMSDVLFVAVSGGAASRHLVDGAVIDALGPQGTLINIARGAVVDETALVEALTEGRLRAAGLDVFVDEPTVPAPLLSMDNVVLQPHRGSATHETRAAMAAAVLRVLADHFGGDALALV